MFTYKPHMCRYHKHLALWFSTCAYNTGSRGNTTYMYTYILMGNANKINAHMHAHTGTHTQACTHRHTHTHTHARACTYTHTCVMPTRTSLLAEPVLSKSGPPDLRNPLAPLTNPFDRISRASSRLGSLSFPFMLGGRGF